MTENTYTLAEVQTLIKESKEVSKQLNAKLAKVRIKLNPVTQADVIRAIVDVFGTSYTSDYGNVYITYEMYTACIKLIRDLGAIVGQDSI
jgi:hypothetical protein